jgi:hypothetical protein
MTAGAAIINQNAAFFFSIIPINFGVSTDG